MAHSLITKAAGYGIDGYVVDGMDVVGVYADMKHIADKCRATSRPAFVDMRTYRYKGHSMSDPRKYRTKEEEEVFETHDPIGRLEARLKTAGLLTDESPVPPMAELYHDVFVEPWGPYTGSSQPAMNGGTANPPSMRTIDTKEELS
jgi:TPP-dependent pyruvate/acetoin dehydrogenase alpha subunit